MSRKKKELEQSQEVVIQEAAVQEVSAQEAVNLKEKPISEEAFPYYIGKETLHPEVEKHARIRNYLPIQWARKLAVALNRQLNIEDLRILVQSDGVVPSCVPWKLKDQTVTKFHALNWVVVGEKLVERIAKEGKTLMEIDQNGGLFRAGHFYVLDGVMAFAGTPFFYRGKTDTNGLLFDEPCWDNPLALASKKFETWGIPKGDAEITNNRIVEARNAKKGNLLSMQSEFDKVVGKAKPAFR